MRSLHGALLVCTSYTDQTTYSPAVEVYLPDNLRHRYTEPLNSPLALCDEVHKARPEKSPPCNNQILDSCAPCINRRQRIAVGGFGPAAKKAIAVRAADSLQVSVAVFGGARQRALPWSTALGSTGPRVGLAAGNALPRADRRATKLKPSHWRYRHPTGTSEPTSHVYFDTGTGERASFPITGPDGAKRPRRPIDGRSLVCHRTASRCRARPTKRGFCAGPSRPQPFLMLRKARAWSLPGSRLGSPGSG
jgi:hypothetical protein